MNEVNNLRRHQNAQIIEYYKKLINDKAKKFLIQSIIIILTSAIAYLLIIEIFKIDTTGKELIKLVIAIPPGFHMAYNYISLSMLGKDINFIIKCLSQTEASEREQNYYFAVKKKIKVSITNSKIFKRKTLIPGTIFTIKNMPKNYNGTEMIQAYVEGPYKKTSFLIQADHINLIGRFVAKKETIRYFSEIEFTNSIGVNNEL